MSRLIHHTETIRCPNCDHIQQAAVLNTAWHLTYIHECTECFYLIMESEWERVEEVEEAAK